MERMIVQVARDNKDSHELIRKQDEATVGLKRFYVDPGYRRQGIAGAVLSALEVQQSR